MCVCVCVCVISYKWKITVEGTPNQVEVLRGEKWDGALMLALVRAGPVEPHRIWDNF